MSVFSTGTSALLAFQRALGTVSHNVANVNTPGYSRQRVELEARPGLSLGAGFVGNGVDIAKLTRLADGLVFARQLDSSGELGRLQALSSFTSRVDTVMSDSASGLSEPWSRFFGASEGLVSEPTSSVARQAVLDAGHQLALRWQSMDAQLSQVDYDNDQRIVSQVGIANQLATEIAKLNRDVIAAGSNASPDLIDQRAIRIEKLAGLVGAETIELDDGSVSVFAGGQSLVLGARANKLTTVQDPFRPDRMQVALDTPGGAVRMSSGGIGGEVGGLLEFRTRVLDPAHAELGRMATAFAQTYNALQRAGIDYNGQPGIDVFNVPPPSVSGRAGNAGSASFTGSVSDLSALTGNNLILRFDAGSWSAVRADTSAPVALSGSGSLADPLRIDGVALVMSGTPSSGDSFMVRPTLDAAGGITLAMRDPNGLAAASPLRGQVDSTNLGNAKVGSSRVTDSTAFGAFAGATIDFIDATSYTINGGPAQTWTPGSAISDASEGWSMTLDGTPVAGDTFILSRTPPRSADNTNARELATVDTRGVLNGGTLGLTAGISQITARIGSEANHAQLNLDAQEAIHAQVTAERESISGVNLDEEAADLMRFQQAYQAAAQIISTADNMFQTLLGAIC